MADRKSFSKRHGHGTPAPITMREGAPEEFRYAIVSAAHSQGDLSANEIRAVVCSVLWKRPDTGQNWSEPNVLREVEGLLYCAPWFKIYDVAEALYQRIAKHLKNAFEDEINDAMRDIGIGWVMENGLFQARGDDTFEESLASARLVVAAKGLVTAESELKEALRDISRRPDPDVSGAVQHAMSALECVARDVFNDNNGTLGDIIKRNRAKWPKPLDEALEKVWGYASNEARHGRENRRLGVEEAQLVVGLSATIASYLSQKALK